MCTAEWCLCHLPSDVESGYCSHQEPMLYGEAACIQILALLLVDCVTLAKLLNLSVSRFLHLED